MKEQTNSHANLSNDLVAKFLSKEKDTNDLSGHEFKLLDKNHNTSQNKIGKICQAGENVNISVNKIFTHIFRHFCMTITKIPL